MNNMVTYPTKKAIMETPSYISHSTSLMQKLVAPKMLPSDTSWAI